MQIKLNFGVLSRKSQKLQVRSRLDSKLRKLPIFESFDSKDQFIIFCYFQVDVNLAEASKNLVLMAYVRNPFSRLASGYLEKFVHEWDWKQEGMEYKWLRDRILVNYRYNS